MLVYRIGRRKYISDLNGTGAGLYGGRWNPPGINLLYTAGSISLAYLEFLAHNYHLLIPNDICLAKIEISADSVQDPGKDGLPVNWNEKSFIPASTQEIGAAFANANKCYALKVPSVIVPDEYNYVLNPRHSGHKKTQIKEIIDPLVLDSRLFQ